MKKIITIILSGWLSILVYDVEDDKLLFPTNDKSFIYNGSITEHRYDGIMKNAIKYISYAKLNGISVENESSIIIWGNESFETLEYQNKLLIETDQYIVYCNKTSSKENELYKPCPAIFYKGAEK